MASTFLRLQDEAELSAAGTVDSCDLAEIPAATFLMGDLYADGFEQERPVHEVWLDGFLIGKHCVTVREVFTFMVSPDGGFQEIWCDYINPCFVASVGGVYRMCDGAGNFPMIQINVVGAMAYCNWVSKRRGLEPVYDLERLDGDLGKSGFRLPTEAEWEYACGGPSRWKHAVSNEFDPALINHRGYAGTQKHLRAGAEKLGGFCLYDASPMPVGTLPPNEFGLYEMLGNVSEWCHDRYVPYTSERQECPGGGRSGSFRVVRGGSFMDGREKLRTSYRYAVNQNTKCMVYGFRLARKAS